MDWWMGIVAGVVGPLMGAAAVQLPDWRARAQRRKRIMSMDPLRAVPHALIAAGLTGQQVADVTAKYNDAYREAYWDVLARVAFPTERFTTDGDGNTVWAPDNSDGPQLGG